MTGKRKNICKFEGCLTVRSVGAKGGLCIFWKDKDLLKVKSYSQNHIDIEISQKDKLWKFTGFYGFPESNQKIKSWGSN